LITLWWPVVVVQVLTMVAAEVQEVLELVLH
jgi:hypothetical protein